MPVTEKGKWKNSKILLIIGNNDLAVLNDNYIHSLVTTHSLVGFLQK